MGGIYIHIPFCRQACYYCNFHFSTSLDLQDEMVSALAAEIEITGKFSNAGDGDKELIETVYFGGGTPSLLSTLDIQRLLQAVYYNYKVDNYAEITIEVNPDDVNPDKLLAWKGAGVNRLSIGVQSFFEKDLLWMNRAHNANQAIQCVAMVKEAGFHNFSADLIYGTPGLTDEEWQQNVERLINFDTPHIACYALTVEPNTTLKKMINLKKKADVDAGDQARQFLLLMKWLKDAGYEHYEISNFAKPGFRSRHNSSYWQGKKYTGIGPSAHSYDGRSRKWNISNNPLYIQSIKNNHIPFDEEILTDVQRMNEYIMTSLRTTEGLDLRFIATHFSTGDRDRIEECALTYISQKKLIFTEDKLLLTDEGKLFADGIASDFFSLD